MSDDARFLPRLSPRADGRPAQPRRKPSQETSRGPSLVVEPFDNLLSSPHYEKLRMRLVRIFAARGCRSPEDLADETIARVAFKLDEIAPTYRGEPIRYFYGVARNVYLEQLREPRWIELDAEHGLGQRSAEPEDGTFDCLDACLGRLPGEERELITEYYRHEKGARIQHRKLLADRFGLGLNALRLRAHRIRGILARCLGECVKNHKSVK